MSDAPDEPSKAQQAYEARVRDAAPELLQIVLDLLDKMEASKPLRTAACRRARTMLSKLVIT